MPNAHHHPIMLEKLRVFLVVLEEGGLRRAADRLHISQSAITRQMQSLELDLGCRVLERTATGVSPTNGGRTLAERAKTLLADYDATISEVRRMGRGESERLRIGYIASAVQEYLARQGLRPGRHTSGVRESFVFARSEALPAKGLFFVRRWLKKGAVSGRAARPRGGGTGF
jgi:molybdenum-dependent DNA-binding transcriptional regulator ModE